MSRKDFDSGVYEAFTYDDRSRPTLVLVKDSGNAEIDRKEYVWDEASRVTSAKEGGYWSYYEYDEIDQLVEEEKPGLSYLATYTYDNNGNRLTRTVNSVTETYAYDEADKLLDITVNSSVVKEYTYDAAGRTTAIEANSQTTSFAYDYEGRVTSITYPNTSSDAFGYNGLGARTSTSGTNGSRTFFRNGLGVTSPVLGDGTADYTPGVSRTESSTTTFAHAGLKNTSTQSAENETVAATKVYDAFGNTVSSSGSWSGPFQYAGNFGYQQDANGLKLLGHRYYDSSTGRFLSIDLLFQDPNRYGYCANSPLSRFDNNGWFWQEIGSIAGCVIGGAVGSLFGPAGTLVGAALGSGLGSFLGGLGDGQSVGQAAIGGVIDAGIGLIPAASALKGAKLFRIIKFKRGWFKILEEESKYTDDLMKTAERLTPALEPKPAKKGFGTVFESPTDPHTYVRIDPPTSSSGPHVHVNDKGSIIDRLGNANNLKNDPNRHIPIDEWFDWPTPMSPK